MVSVLVCSKGIFSVLLSTVLNNQWAPPARSKLCLNQLVPSRSDPQPSPPPNAAKYSGDHRATVSAASACLIFWQPFFNYGRRSVLSVHTPVALVAQFGNSTSFVTQTSSLGPWIHDFGASDNMSGNKLLFSHLTYMDTLPNVTLANGSQAKCEGIGQTSPLPTLTLDSVLYVPSWLSI